MTPGWMVVCVSALAFIVRLIPVVAGDFPLNDGALFLSMSEALAEAGWVPPPSIEWNGETIPFAYPPIGFYLTAVTTALAGSGEAALRIIPLIAASICAPLVALLASRLTGSVAAAAIAGIMYALSPAAFDWLIHGGGVTRAPGMALALLTLWLFLGMLREPDVRRSLLVGGAAGLTALTHPGAATFLVLSAVLLLIDAVVRGGGSRSVLRAALTALGVGALIVAPWVLLTASRHGLAVFVEVTSNGPHPLDVLVDLIAARATSTGTTDPLAATVLALAILQLVRRRWLLPVWWVAASLLGYQYGIVPACLLVGTFGAELVGLTSAKAATSRRIGLVGTAVLAAMLVWEGWLGITAGQNPSTYLHALSPERREAMSWVAQNTAPDARVAVITGSSWADDAASEWFYRIGERVSAATVQGSEWLGASAYHDAQVRYQSLQRCADRGAECVGTWLEHFPVDYIYVAKGPEGESADCCAAARDALLASDDFAVVHDAPGATILEVVGR